MTRSLKKNPFVANHLLRKIKKPKHKSRKRNNSNLVQSIYHYTHNDWSYDCYPKWKRAFTYLYNRSYGRTQIGRIFTYYKLPGTREK
uniref:Ribosomal protein S19 n=1 Tax=Vachellia nilotica TaxID=138033 RepID=A0A650F2L6_9FABA|nr:ribosomal protein S19 [Vachellia nilotica]QGT77179.1 ribosomal protein S19 [Vachellia nilotica]